MKIGASSALGPQLAGTAVEESKVDAELTPVLIPVAEHDVPQKLLPRLGKDFLSAGYQAPGFFHCRVVELRQQVPHRCDTVIKRIEDFLAVPRLRKAKALGLRRAALYEADNSAWNRGKMVCKLPC
jgi:hypothetical protein